MVELRDPGEEEIYADWDKKLPYINSALEGKNLDPIARYFLENMDCFGDYDAEVRACTDCMLGQKCEEYRTNQ